MPIDRKSFISLLSKQFYPVLRAEGFRGSGTTLRRMNGPEVHVFNVQGSTSSIHCYFNLGVHLTFLPTAGGELLEPNEITESSCVFRDRISPPEGLRSAWLYGETESEAQANVDRALQEWERQARPFFAAHAYPEGIARLMAQASLTETHPAHLLKFARIAAQLERKERAAELAHSALGRVAAAATGLRFDIEQFLRHLA
jgi:hypothetical protein